MRLWTNFLKSYGNSSTSLTQELPARVHRQRGWAKHRLQTNLCGRPVAQTEEEADWSRGGGGLKELILKARFEEAKVRELTVEKTRTRDAQTSKTPKSSGEVVSPPPPMTQPKNATPSSFGTKNAKVKCLSRRRHGQELSVPQEESTR